MSDSPGTSKPGTTECPVCALQATDPKLAFMDGMAHILVHLHDAPEDPPLFFCHEHGAQLMGMIKDCPTTVNIDKSSLQ